MPAKHFPVTDLERGLVFGFRYDLAAGNLVVVGHRFAPGK
jgi:hypothetical protein